MTISTRRVQVTFDCADPGALATFWCQVLGYRIDPPQGFRSWPEALDARGAAPEEYNARCAAADPEGIGPRLLFQRVPEDKVVKNRVHLDVRVAPDVAGPERMAALQAESDRLQGLGARQVRRVEPDGRMETGFIWLEDPEGNEFCLD